MLQILARDDLCVESEGVLLDLVLRWAEDKVSLQKACSRESWCMIMRKRVGWNFPFYHAPTSFFNPAVDIDFGLSRGRPSARSQTSEAVTPRALDIPTSTV